MSAIAGPSTLPASPMKGRKRAITLISGGELDISRALSPAQASDPSIVEAMRQRIIQLEDEVSTYAQSPAKRRKIDSGAAAVIAGTPKQLAAAAKAEATAAKAEEKQRKAQLKKIFERLKREVKSEDCKFKGGCGPKTIKIDEVMEPNMFKAIFEGKGHLVQPRPDNKPKSSVTIITFTNEQHIRDLFGDELKELKGSRWTQGGIHAGKAQKIGTCDVRIDSIDVNYAVNTMKCILKIDVSEKGARGYDGWGSY